MSLVFNFTYTPAFDLAHPLTHLPHLLPIQPSYPPYAKRPPSTSTIEPTKVFIQHDYTQLFDVLSLYNSTTFPPVTLDESPCALRTKRIKLPAQTRAPTYPSALHIRAPTVGSPAADVAYREDPRNSLLAGDPNYRPYVTERNRERAARRSSGFRMYKPNTTWTWAFMIAATLQAAVVLGLESYIFARFQMALTPGLPPVAKTKVIPTYLTLFIFGFVYELVLVYDSLRLKNTIQVIGLCLYNLGLLVYSSVQVDQINEAVWTLYRQTSPSYLIEGQLLWPVIKPYLIAIPVIIGFFTAVLGFIAWKLYDEFAWTIYKHISADLRMKRRFLAFQVCTTL